MTETTEEIIARLAKDRAKTILENSDYWSSPGAAKTSAEAIGTLLSYRWQLEAPPSSAQNALLVAEEPPQQVEAPKPKRQPKESPAPAPVTPDESEPADV